MTPQGCLVLVESPFKSRSRSSSSGVDADAVLNMKYVRALCRYVALSGDNPFASHIFCTEFLNDFDSDERRRGISIGLAWGALAQKTFVGVDRGISEGMEIGIAHAREAQRPIIWISLSDFAETWLPQGVDREAWKKFYRDHDQLLFLSNGSKGGDNADS